MSDNISENIDQFDVIAAIAKRRSYPRLQEPAPNNDQLQSIFEAALRAPDHMRLRPWRFLTISGDNRMHLGNLFAEHELAYQSELKSQTLDQARKKAFRAPLILVGIAAPREHPKVPRIEQVVSTGGVLNIIGLATYLSGFGAVWRTGDYAYSPIVKAGLSVSQSEEIVGFMYIGTPINRDRDPPSISLDDYIYSWP